MREIASIGIQTVIVSWWGPGSAEAARLPPCSGPRARPGFGSRCTSSRSPAGRRRRSRPSSGPSRATGITDFYIYDSTTSPTPNGARSTSSCRGCGCSPTRACPARPRRVASRASTPTTSASTTGRRSPACARRRGCTACSALPRSAPASTPSARPGHAHPGAGRRRDLRPHVAGRDPRRRRRRHDHELQRMARGNADRAGQGCRGPYASYDGAYGLSGRAAERAYLDRTAAWVRALPRVSRPLNRQ